MDSFHLNHHIKRVSTVPNSFHSNTTSSHERSNSGIDIDTLSTSFLRVVVVAFGWKHLEMDPKDLDCESRIEEFIWMTKTFVKILD